MNEFLEKMGKKNYEELTESEKRIYNISLKAQKEREGLE